MVDVAGQPWIAPEGRAAASRARRCFPRKPRLAALSDVRGWAFCQQMHDMEEYLGHGFDVTHLYVADWLTTTPGVYQEHPDLSWFDSVYCPYHRWHIDNLLPREKTLGSLRAQWLVPEHRRPPRHEEFDVVNSFVAFNVVSRRNYREYHAACPDLWYLTNPVNMRRFPKATPKRDELIASWNGNAGHSNALHEDVKGFHSIVRPACARVGVPLVFAEYGLHRKTPAEMPEFYQQANVALSASLYEGASSAVMESMASGLAVVVTDCGNHREMQLAQLRRFGQTGIRIVERSIDAFEQELRVLKEDPTLIAEMGEINRESIRLDWSWDVWIEGFIEFLLTPLRGEA